jgi:hypothetical protein
MGCLTDYGPEAEIISASRPSWSYRPDFRVILKAAIYLGFKDCR